MPKRKTGVILLICAAILVLSSYVIALECRNQNRKEIFINEAYFLLKDLHSEISNHDTESLKLSSSLSEILVELDLRCVLQSQEMWTAFSYPRPGVFEVIKSNISKGIYTQEELTELAMDIQALIDELSDETGNAENRNIPYKELNGILEIFHRKWGTN